MGSLNQRFSTAFVSGASSGLGREFTRMLLGEGIKVWGSSRDVSRLAGVSSPECGLFFPVELDLADPSRALGAFNNAASAAGGGFDLLVNNAGYGVFGPFDEIDSSAWQAQIRDMLGTVLALSHEAYRSMRAKGHGCIVHVSSLAAEFPLPYMSGYNVAKAGLSALSESLIFEARGSGVHVIDFRPGDYRTDFNRAVRKGAASGLPQKAWDALESSLAAAPAPEKAARDLKRALLSNRSGVIRSGSFFQARLAPLLSRCVPASLTRWATARYFGS